MDLGLSGKTRAKPSCLDFDRASYPWKAGINYRARPKLYRGGEGEQGVLICEPYKGELTPHWSFKTPAMAKRSAAKIFKMFETYLAKGEFVDADMSRKFLQTGYTGYTRARSYANYKSGHKYDRENGYALKERGAGDPLKAEGAQIFCDYWKKAEAEPDYASQKQAWKAKLG
jgi:Domain of unknown function (DUF4385)